MANVRYCWLDTNGDFSNSWSEEEHKKFFDDSMLPPKDGTKLIRYECVNNDGFEFTHKMKLNAVTPSKKKPCSA